MSTKGRDTQDTPLRVRKRNRTRRALQRAAIDLIERNGYQATSVDEICAAAEVSRSTFFRYFGSKDAVFQSDLIEEEALGLLHAPGERSLRAMEDRICAAFETVSPEDWETERRRLRLVQTVPELRASLLNEVFRPFALAVDYVAGMVGLPSDSLRVRTIAGAIVGAFAARQLPDANGNYELPESLEDAIEVYRSTFRELNRVLDNDRLQPQADPEPR